MTFKVLFTTFKFFIYNIYSPNFDIYCLIYDIYSADYGPIYNIDGLI